MKRMANMVGAVLGTVALAAATAATFSTGIAQADPGPVFFNAGSANCAIFDDGTVGCDLGGPVPVQYSFLPATVKMNKIVISQPWLPAHPSTDPGTPYTLAGGNPALADVKSGDGQWGPYVEYAGAKCEAGFHGSFTCSSKGRSWTWFAGVISA
ncbi:hypothetical protein [Nocardia noduli]|uniref:hypothetical protein n=1 Tax=Nocardia noduli TaxID=2815722 RepID=UPI001C22A482|nr:hypothetical protein [Nocardia noduli]